jgi:hypothetical protein
MSGEPELCGGTVHEGEHYTCGRAVLRRDPARREDACPGGLVMCEGCVDEGVEFLRAAYDAAAKRAEHQPF